MEEIVPKFNYIVVVILMMTGLWSMLAQSNLIKKCIGMAIFQTGIILFFISIGAKDNASIPIVAKEPVNQALGQAHAPEGSQPQAKPELAAAKAKDYPNPPDVNKFNQPIDPDPHAHRDRGGRGHAGRRSGPGPESLSTTQLIR